MSPDPLRMGGVQGQDQVGAEHNCKTSKMQLFIQGHSHVSTVFSKGLYNLFQVKWYSMGSLCGRQMRNRKFPCCGLYNICVLILGECRTLWGEREQAVTNCQIAKVYQWSKCQVTVHMACSQTMFVSLLSAKENCMSQLQKIACHNPTQDGTQANNGDSFPS